MHAGVFNTHVTRLHCTKCKNKPVYPSEALARVVPDHGNFGYDVLVFTGKAMLRRHRNSRETCNELAARNIQISPREIDYRDKIFIIYLAMAHRRVAPRIGKIIANPMLPELVKNLFYNTTKCASES